MSFFQQQMTLAIGALLFAPNILIDPLISSSFYLSFYSMASLVLSMATATKIKRKEEAYPWKAVVEVVGT
jgi:hypothetical protein